MPREARMPRHDEQEGAHRASRERLIKLGARLDGDILRRPLGEHWTVAMGLLHLAFWDRFVVERWRHAAVNGLTIPPPIEDYAEDRVNDTLTQLFKRVPVAEALPEALEAAQAVEDVIAQLSSEVVEAVQRAGAPRLLDRSIHRAEHLDEIEAAVGW